MVAIQENLGRARADLPSGGLRLATPKVASPPQATLSLPMRMMVYATVGTFYLSNAYLSDGASPLAVLTTLKWIPLGCLGMMCFAKASRTPLLAPNLGVVSILLFPLLVSVFVSDDMTRSAAYVVSVAVVLLTGQVIALQLPNRQQFQLFTDIIKNIGFVLIASSACMWLLGMNWGRGAPRFSAWSDNPNTLGLMLAPVLTILFANVLQRRRRWTWIDAPFLLVGLFVLAETQARASILWVATAAAALLFGRRIRPLTLCFVLCGLVLALNFHHQIESFAVVVLRHREEHATADLLSGRMEQWNLGLSLFAKQPWFGYGFGMSQPLIEAYDWVFISTEGDAFHNSYLTILVETGLVGLVVSGGFFLLSALGGFVTIQRAQGLSREEWVSMALPWAMTCGALAHGFFESWLFSAGNANGMLFWTFLFLMRKGGARFTARKPEPLQQWR